mmetsp:Transcript_1476/g.3988  ORF Transcript_1476/g.3988 Transcript_1476/m.3988 type:complete len:235 (-) Transcript_1476:842-1546(-)
MLFLTLPGLLSALRRTFSLLLLVIITPNAFVWSLSTLHLILGSRRSVRKSPLPFHFLSTSVILRAVLVSLSQPLGDFFRAAVRCQVFKADVPVQFRVVHHENLFGRQAKGILLKLAVLETHGFPANDVIVIESVVPFNEPANLAILLGFRMRFVFFFVFSSMLRTRFGLARFELSFDRLVLLIVIFIVKLLLHLLRKRIGVEIAVEVEVREVDAAGHVMQLLQPLHDLLLLYIL